MYRDVPDTLFFEICAWDLVVRWVKIESIRLDSLVLVQLELVEEPSYGSAATE
jgi:hypothetical protein